MATPNMATITASLERSLQNCSLNHQHSSSSSSSSSSAGGGGVARPSDSPADSPTPTLELNSQASLPFHWEQCLDLKTGEIYFINWRTGMKATEDPRAAVEYGGDYSEVEVEEEEGEEDSSSYDSEGSSSESSPCSSREQWSGKNNEENCYYEERNENSHNSISNNINSNSSSNNNSNVLVVAGCKSCLMYYMVPKQLEICPKCCGQLLHFDRSENGSS